MRDDITHPSIFIMDQGEMHGPDMARQNADMGRGTCILQTLHLRYARHEADCRVEWPCAGCEELVFGGYAVGYALF